MKKVLCFGDSLTQGKPGITYVKYMDRSYNCKNYGLGGDTLLGMTRRLEKVSRRRDFKDVTDIVVGIGANDIIQSFLNDYSWLWKIRVKTLIMRGSICSSNGSEFKENYEKLIFLLKKTNKNVIIFSIPYIETNESIINEQVIIYNKIIKELCELNNIPFVDYWSWQIENKVNSKTGAFMSKNPLLVGLDTLLTTYLPFNDYISKKRGLVLTVDGCHTNKFAAKGLANLIDNEISK